VRNPYSEQAIVVALAGFLISGILLVLMALYRLPPDWRSRVLQVFALLALVASIGRKGNQSVPVVMTCSRDFGPLIT
jgi:hypothetical protein